MDTPSLDLYAAEPLDDGLRVYRSDDAVYEAWAVDDPEAGRPVPLPERGPNVFSGRIEKAQARVYRDDGVWHAKVRFPEAGLEEAYDRVIATAEDVNDVYGTALDISPKRFRERVEADGTVTIDDQRTTLHYREETELNELVEDLLGGEIADSSLAKGILVSGATWMGAWTAAGAGIGAAVGSLAGPPGMVGGATIGASMAGPAGLGMTLGDGILPVMASRIYPDFLWEYGGGLPADRATRYFEERRQRKQYTAVDAVEEHLSAVNRLHSLEAELEATREMDLEQHEELEALRDNGIDAVHDGLMDVHFRRFEAGAGVTAVHTADSHAEAVDFLATVGAAAVDCGERPSLYTSSEAFQTVFDHLTYRERGETKYLDDARILGGNVQERDVASQDVEDWLTAVHLDVMRSGRQG